MKNCLVTKLNAVVNNPDLPVLETMQQFTLDAITASGNASMTDAQKMALNHFFYQIGAIENTALWQKIQALALPMICGDNLTYACVNYVNNVNPGAATGSFNGKHGFVGASQKVSAYTGSANGLCLLYVSTNDTKPTANFTCAGALDTNNSGYMSARLNADSTSGFNWRGLDVRFSASEGVNIGVCAISTPTTTTMHSLLNGEINTQSASYTMGEGTISNKNVIIGGDSTYACGVSMFAIGLTNDEAIKLLKASMNLREYFI